METPWIHSSCERFVPSHSRLFPYYPDLYMMMSSPVASPPTAAAASVAAAAEAAAGTAPAAATTTTKAGDATSPAAEVSNSNAAAAASNSTSNKQPNAIEFEPPLACVRRILKNSLPSSTNVGKDASAAFARACGIFIIYLTSCANDFARENKRQTITAHDVLAALTELDFDDFTPQLTSFLESYRATEKSKKESKAAKVSNMTTAKPKAAAAAADDEEEAEEEDVAVTSPTIAAAAAASHEGTMNEWINPPSTLSREKNCQTL
jgi:DNA polymerase epsilon subunit 3